MRCISSPWGPLTAKSRSFRRMSGRYQVDAEAHILWLAVDGSPDSLLDSLAAFHNDHIQVRETVTYARGPEVPFVAISPLPFSDRLSAAPQTLPLLAAAHQLVPPEEDSQIVE